MGLQNRDDRRSRFLRAPLVAAFSVVVALAAGHAPAAPAAAAESAQGGLAYSSAPTQAPEYAGSVVLSTSWGPTNDDSGSDGPRGGNDDRNDDGKNDNDHGGPENDDSGSD